MAFLSTPTAAEGNGAEAKFARGYMCRNSTMQRTANGDAVRPCPVPVEPPVCDRVSSGEAKHRQEKQTKLFGKLDAFSMEETSLFRSSHEPFADHSAYCPEAGEEAPDMG